MAFTPGIISNLFWKPLKTHGDSRGWLAEMFRADELPAGYSPLMGYVSQTATGVARGPHEHAGQSDCFCFIGPSDFELVLWDSRPGSPTIGVIQREVVGASRPMLVIVPPRVVHGYKNIGSVDGIVYNFPNTLYKGAGRNDPVDEIRHELDPNSIYKMD
jgi:dTDP-4-dehydrorhamnose 3,5-epimerase